MWKQKLLAFRKKTAGVTLVELIVTFALIGMFMTAASFMLTSSLRLFIQLQSVSGAVTVSDVLLDKIAGEIAAAKEPDMDNSDAAFDYGGYYIWMEKDDGSQWMTLWNRSGSPMAIYADGGGELCLKYYETVRGKVGAEVTDDSLTVPEMDWHFDHGVYMGYRITEGGLTFTREDPENHPNVIRIDLEIHNEKSGFTYRASRYAECYNYKFTETQVKKYLCVRPGEPEMPEKAVDFVIRKVENGGGEAEKPDTSEKPDGYFQGVIPLDSNGWWRNPDTAVNETNGPKTQTVNPGGIAKWETSGSRFYYVVIRQVVGNGYDIQTPTSGNETTVIQIPDLEILQYDQIKPSLKPWQGSEYHARVFSYKGSYYVRLGYQSPLGSPEEQPSEWYKLIY